MTAPTRDEFAALAERVARLEGRMSVRSAQAGRLLSDELADERSLADDLMEVLSRTVVGWENVIGHDLSQHPEVVRVAARYRKARGR
jgi:hypothetical protein